jgi:dolichol-phosphate mannosyltransferase
MKKVTDNKEIVVIIVPTYNEAGNIEKLVDYLYNKIFVTIPQKYDMHVLVVDDSSPDGTSQLIKKLVESNSKLHLLVNKKKAGLGNAYTKGMEFALEKLHADIVFEFDADFSHDPEKIPIMLARLEKNYDMVLGSRYIKGGSIPDDWGFHRKFLSVFGNFVIRVILFNFSIKDWTTGYRAIRASVVRAVLPQLHHEKFMGYTFQIGFLHAAVRGKFAIAEVPIDFIDRTHGNSKLGTEYIKNTMTYIIKVRIKEIYTSRLFRFVVVGVIGAVVQLGSLQLLRQYFPYQLAYFISVELAVISNFIWSNLWTFSDAAIQLMEIPVKFVQFNITSFGSIVIQQTLAYFGETYIGLYTVFTLPLLGVEIDTGLLFAVLGILLGMTWNFVAYTRLIWKTKK